MNRNEEIQKASQKRHLEKYCCEGFCAEFINGAKWADSTLIEKAAEWLASNVRCDGYTLQTKAKLISDFRKAMEK